MRTAITALAIALVTMSPAVALAHCQVPCGIYDDEMRIGMIEEHIRTIEKAMTQIEALAAEETPNHNQIVRWVMTKEEHAIEIQEIVSDYFLTQRIKPGPAGDEEARQEYHALLAELHHMLLLAMKCRQNVDTEIPAQLVEATEAFSVSYFGEAHPYHH